MVFNIVGTDRTYRAWILNSLVNITNSANSAFRCSYTIPIAYTSTSTFCVNFSLQANHSLNQTCSIISPTVFFVAGNYSAKYTLERIFIILFGY